MSALYGTAYLERQTRRSALRQGIRSWYLRRHARLCVGPTLDIGCGAGDLLARLPPGSAGLEVNPHAVAFGRARGLDVMVFDPERDGYTLSTIGDRRFATLVCSHVLEHLDAPGDVMRALLAAARRRGIERAVFIVPGRRGFGHDATHREFVDRDRLTRERLLSPDGWRLRELAYFPGNLRWLGDYLTHHELTLVYERGPA